MASLDSPTTEPVQTIILPKNTKARFVTLAIQRKDVELMFREVEIYNGPLLGNNDTFLDASKYTNKMLILLNCILRLLLKHVPRVFSLPPLRKYASCG